MVAARLGMLTGRIGLPCYSFANQRGELILPGILQEVAVLPPFSLTDHSQPSLTFSIRKCTDSNFTELDLRPFVHGLIFAGMARWNLLFSNSHVGINRIHGSYY